MMADPPRDSVAAVDQHIHRYFADHVIETHTWDTGPLRIRVPTFRVHAIAPGPRSPGRWTYITTGCWDAAHQAGHGLEFVLTTRRFAMRAIELLAINAYFHAGPAIQRLDLGHTINLGKPWLPGSACDHGLISVPYPWGPELEQCEWTGGHARLLWLLPITREERDLKTRHGVEQLERRLERAGVDYTDPRRPSVA